MNLRVASCDLRGLLAWAAPLFLWSLLIAIPARGDDAIGAGSATSVGSSIVNRHSSIPTVGLEGRLEVVLPGTLLEARPVEHKAKLLLRIAETSPRDKAVWYDLRYIGMVPGSYDLRGYLMRADGSSTNDLPAIPVTIAPLLPDKHDGQLIEPPASALTRLGGYKALMIGAAALWAALFVPIVWRKRARQIQSIPLPREPTLAERMQPLLEQAAQGTLSTDGRAQLERMLLTHWRQKLNLEGLGMVEAVTKLREHSEAGALLRALETWLHRPPGGATVDMNTVLEPYRRDQPSRKSPDDETPH